jgi:MYXO-CTERM domain-containing protein
VTRLVLPLWLLWTASPALAASAVIPEASSFALFGLGVLGVLVGRRSARRKRD